MSNSLPFPAEAVVYLVDDDVAIRDSLSFLFASRKARVVVLDSGEALLATLPLAGCACVVLDMRMGGMTGLETFDRLKLSGCHAPVIFLTGHGDVPVAVEALKKGAADFIEKPFNDNHLVDTVIACLAKYAGQLGESQEKARIHLRLQSLSEREAEVLKLMLEGRLNKQIADDLTISMRTVEVHRARILAKMQARNAVELAAQLSSLGLDPK